MFSAKRPSYYQGGRSAKRARRFQRRIVKYVRHRRKGAARPSRSVSTGYRGTPNQYRFIRETRPTTIDMGTVGNGVTLLAGTGDIPDMSILQFPNFEMNQVPGYTDFSSLFANFKIDKIETILVPMWQESVNPDGAGSGTTQLPNLMMTRINTKWLVNGITIAADAETQRDELAQIMKKSRSLYGTKKWLKITTSNPNVTKTIPDGSGGTNTVIEPQPWLSTTDSADQQFQMNDVLFADRLDGEDFDPDVYLYRMYHRVHFRTSFVG